MARNTDRSLDTRYAFQCDDPPLPKSGDPVRIGSIVGVALIDERADGKTTVALRGIFDLTCTAGAAAIKPGDEIFYHDSAAGPPAVAQFLNNTAAGGTHFGWAVAEVAGNILGAGATGVVAVKLGA